MFGFTHISKNKYKIRHAAWLICVIICVCAFAGCGQADESLMQLQELEDDDTVAVITVRGMGNITVRLFPEEAPRTVENFINLSNDGYYDGMSFATVVKDYCIMTGATEGGEAVSSFGGYFEDEISDRLFPIRGALCMANAGDKDTNSSQVFIVGQKAEKIAEIDELLAYKGITMEDYIRDGYDTDLEGEELEKYFEYGGMPWVYGHNTVFGQVCEGMDIVDAILGVETDDAQPYVPLDEVIIDKIEIAHW